MSNTQEKQGSFHQLKKRIEKYHSGQGDSLTKIVQGTLGIIAERQWNWSIYKVPSFKKDCYKPRIISIGPFHHHKNDQLMDMEEHKWRFMLSLLGRKAPNERKTLHDFLQLVQENEKEARGCYAADFKFNKDKLMEILLVDACFIIELFIRYAEKYSPKGDGIKIIVDNDKIVDDKIFDNAWMLPTIRNDLALLENQIPFSVLEGLFKSIGIDSYMHISDYALGFFNINGEVKKHVNLNGSRHLLEMLHKFYLPSNSKRQYPNGCSKDIWDFKHSASELLEAGIEIKKGSSKRGCLLNIKFSPEQGVIRIPPLSIDETLESILRNLIAFEQCSVGTTHHITSYALLMKVLIKSPQDIDLLERKGIISNKLTSAGHHVSTFFHSLCREVIVPKEFYFAELCEQLNAYNKSWCHWHRVKAWVLVRWRRYMAALANDYFSNPWRIISFVAAVVLLILTALQTIYTLRPGLF